MALQWRIATTFLSLATVAHAAPNEDLQGRRAIRGTPVESAHESSELKSLRAFEEDAFPRDEAPLERSASLTAGVGPDALRDELRSPEPKKNAGDAPNAIPWLSQLKFPDLPIRLDPRVVRYLEFYKSDKRGRAIMTSWLKARGRWHALETSALEKAKLPIALEYVSMIESGYDPHDRSSAGAVGLWQFMPAGAKIYGLRIDHWVDQRKDPEKATEAVTRYLADLKERFGGWPLALAAFNAGYGAVLRAMQKYNTNDYWELCRHEDGLPWDTMLYVPKVMAVALVGENARLFGFQDVVPDVGFGFDKASVPSSTSFAQIARAAGVTQQEIEALNPELRRKRTPPESWSVRLPKGTGPRFAGAFEREKVKPFVVRFGERLDDVARMFAITPRELKQLNGIEDSTEFRPGLTIVVPDGKGPIAPPPCETTIVAVPDKDFTVAGKRRVFYRTLSGDSIQDVSVFFRVKPSDVARWNSLDLDAKLCGNLVLELFVDQSFDTSQAALVDPSTVRVVTTGSDEFFDLVEARRGRVRLSYVVKKGDDLKRIGKKFGLTVADLERINRFGSKAMPLSVGQKLVVYRAMSAAEKAKAACRLVPDSKETAPAAKAAPAPADDDNDSDDVDDPVPLPKLPRLPKDT
jgi:membrane-bound lytic murein transglycosylase D